MIINYLGYITGALFIWIGLQFIFCLNAIAIIIGIILIILGVLRLKHTIQLFKDNEDIKMKNQKEIMKAALKEVVEDIKK